MYLQCCFWSKSSVCPIINLWLWILSCLNQSIIFFSHVFFFSQHRNSNQKRKRFTCLILFILVLTNYFFFQTVHSRRELLALWRKFAALHKKQCAQTMFVLMLNLTNICGQKVFVMCHVVFVAVCLVDVMKMRIQKKNIIHWSPLFQ